MHIRIGANSSFSYMFLDMYQAMSHCTPRARADLMQLRTQPEAVTVKEVERALNHCFALQKVVDCELDYALITDEGLLDSQVPGHEEMSAWMKDSDLVIVGWRRSWLSQWRSWSSIPSVLGIYPSSHGITRISAYVVNQRMAKDLLLHGYPINLPIDYTLQAVSDMMGKRVSVKKNPLSTRAAPYVIDYVSLLFFSGIMFCLGCCLGAYIVH
jgi:hypothetical protein